MTYEHWLRCRADGSRSFQAFDGAPQDAVARLDAGIGQSLMSAARSAKPPPPGTTDDEALDALWKQLSPLSVARRVLHKRRRRMSEEETLAGGGATEMCPRPSADSPAHEDSAENGGQTDPLLDFEGPPRLLPPPRRHGFRMRRVLLGTRCAQSMSALFLPGLFHMYFDMLKRLNSPLY